MNATETNEYINKLVGVLSMKADYARYIKGEQSLLIVEGTTDRTFIEKIRTSNVTCEIVTTALGLKKRSDDNENRKNNKRIIMQTVYGLSVVPVLLKIPKGFEKCKVYGMIDLDYDESCKTYLTSPKLFVTDTHDLETLLMSTDSGIIQRIEDCDISDEEMKKALFVAFQIETLKQAIRENGIHSFDLGVLDKEDKSEIVDYSSFLEGYNVNVRSLIKYINKNNAHSVSVSKEKKISEEVIKDRRIRKLLNENSVWKQEWQNFDHSTINDFWKVIQGHTVLSLLRYINQSAYDKYININNYSINRDFEMDLIKHYDFACIRKTNMYIKMLDSELVN